MTLELFLLIIVVITALAFDFTNGFHDTGNAMAVIIGVLFIARDFIGAHTGLYILGAKHK